VKTTVDLPDSLVKQLKLRALRDGKKLKQTVAEVIRAGLAIKAATEKHAAPARVVIIKDPRTGIPVFQGSSNAPAREMSIEQILALEQQAQLQEDFERVGLSS
jgi:hypothetical protein